MLSTWIISASCWGGIGMQEPPTPAVPPAAPVAANSKTSPKPKTPPTPAIDSVPAVPPVENVEPVDDTGVALTRSTPLPAGALPVPATPVIGLPEQTTPAPRIDDRGRRRDSLPPLPPVESSEGLTEKISIDDDDDGVEDRPAPEAPRRPARPVAPIDPSTGISATTPPVGGESGGGGSMPRARSSRRDSRPRNELPPPTQPLQPEGGGRMVPRGGMGPGGTEGLPPGRPIGRPMMGEPGMGMPFNNQLPAGGGAGMMGMGRGGGGGSGGGVEPFDPRLREYQAQEERLEKGAHDLAMNIRRENQPQDKAKMVEELKKVLSTQFEVRQARRKYEIKKVEDELKRLHLSIEKREKNRESIIDRRLGNLIGDEDFDF